MARTGNDKTKVDLVLISALHDQAVLVIKDQPLSDLERFAIGQLGDDLRVRIYDSADRIFDLTKRREDPEAYAQ